MRCFKHPHFDGTTPITLCPICKGIYEEVARTEPHKIKLPHFQENLAHIEAVKRMKQQIKRMQEIMDDLKNR